MAGKQETLPQVYLLKSEATDMLHEVLDAISTSMYNQLDHWKTTLVENARLGNVEIRESDDWLSFQNIRDEFKVRHGWLI